MECDCKKGKPLKVCAHTEKRFHRFGAECDIYRNRWEGERDRSGVLAFTYLLESCLSLIVLELFAKQ